MSEYETIETDDDRLDIIRSVASITGRVLVRHAAGQFDAVFSNAYLESAFSGTAVENRQPMITARTIDVKDLAKDTPLEIGSTTYLVKRHEPDGTGMSIVLLKG